MVEAIKQKTAGAKPIIGLALSTVLVAASFGFCTSTNAWAADLPAPAPTPVPESKALKPLAPKIAPTPTPQTTPTSTQAGDKSAAQASTKNAHPADSANAGDMLEQLSKLEKVMFGASQPSIPLAYRLDRLESEVFHQTNPQWTSKARIDRLSGILLGGGSNSAAPAPTATGSAAMPATAPAYVSPTLPPADGGTPLPPAGESKQTGFQSTSPYLPVPPEISSPEFSKALDRQQLEAYALQLINQGRTQVGLRSLEADDTAYKVAKDLVADLCKRNCVMHINSLGENPDVRYTKAGGSDCIVESLTTLKLKGRPTPSKELVYNIVRQLLEHQDDREALFSSHASHFGFTFDISAPGDHIIACAETVTREGHVDALPSTIHVGDKVDIKGRVNEPYKFQRITIAWEGLTSPPEDNDPDDEAAPFFPPLDYEAYACHAEHDFQKAERVLQYTGMALALAGGLFVPPVALAAPLIAAAPPSKPKAISEIPVHRGVHSDGYSFDVKIPVAKENKEGIYYITVWAKSEVDQAPFAISRRAVVATTGTDHTAAKPMAERKEEVQMKVKNSK